MPNSFILNNNYIEELFGYMFFSCLCQSWLSVSLCLPALRSRSGRSIINGNWAIDRPGKYEGAGTMFTYRRPNEISSTAGESFLAEGPTNEILDVYVSKKNQLEPQESYGGGSPCFFIYLYFFADLRNGVKFWKCKCWKAYSSVLKWLSKSHLLSLRWSSSSQILVFTMSTLSHLRSSWALSNQAAGQEVNKTHFCPLLLCTNDQANNQWRK